MIVLYMVIIDKITFIKFSTHLILIIIGNEVIATQIFVVKKQPYRFCVAGWKSCQLVSPHSYTIIQTSIFLAPLQHKFFALDFKCKRFFICPYSGCVTSDLYCSISMPFIKNDRT